MTKKSDDWVEQEVERELAAEDNPPGPKTITLTVTEADFEALSTMTSYIVKSYTQMAKKAALKGEDEEAKRYAMVARGYEVLLTRIVAAGEVPDGEDRVLH